MLAYPKIRKVLGWDHKAIESFLKQLLVRMELVDISGSDPKEPCDRSDAPILASLIAANADFLVTGDSDLLSLREEFPILSPAEFADRL